MASTNRIDYTPPTTIKAFIKDYRPAKMFYDWIVGPVGSGKTTGLFFKLVFMAKLQARGPDGVRRSRAVVVRNTAPQLKDTTLVSWAYWFKSGQAGDWYATDKRFVLRFDDVECEVLFRPLDTPDDVARVLSLEVTFALIDEFVQIPKAIIEALAARCGRFPPKNQENQDGSKGATNWGMWGSSNPDTEDNWWYDYLHSNSEVQKITRPGTPEHADMVRRMQNHSEAIAKYFHQPSGFDPNAENLDNLPGGREYYTEQAKGKSVEWIKQFVEAEWGFSIAGKPVIGSFKPMLHIAHKGLLFNPLLNLVAGFDPGLAGSAFVFGQQDHHGRVMVLGELCRTGIGAERLIKEHLKPYLRQRFPQLRKLIICPDPAANFRSMNDERTVVQTVRKYFEIWIESNNRLPLRVDAIDYFATQLVDIGPALAIDEQECPMVIRALKGGWRYVIDPKKDNTLKNSEPEKNQYSHPGDACGYLCRYFHRQSEREMRHGGKNRFVPPKTFGPSYHYK